MSARLLKKVLKEQEEAVLAQQHLNNSGDDSDSPDSPIPSSSKNPFDLLNDNGQDQVFFILYFLVFVARVQILLLSSFLLWGNRMVGQNWKSKTTTHFNGSSNRYSLPPLCYAIVYTLDYPVRASVCGRVQLVCILFKEKL